LTRKGEFHREREAAPRSIEQFHFATVLSDDAADNEEAESAAPSFGRKVGLENFAHLLLWNSAA
jgi:hypothetical protein